MRVKRMIAVGAALVMAAGVGLAAPAAANQGGYGEGCTPGFWKNHLDWKSYDDNSNPTNDDFLPGSDVEDALRINVPNSYSGDSYDFEAMTSLEALQGGGGPGLEGATKILLRASVAAYLNADAALDFPLRAPSTPRGVDPAPVKKRTGGDYDTDWARRTPARMARAALVEGPMRLAGSALGAPDRRGADRLNAWMRQPTPLRPRLAGSPTY